MQKKDTIQFIESQGKWGMKLGLETIKALLEKLGNPQNDLKFIHVAGSNGKGSICRILETALFKSGYSVGLYTSPALEKFNERIRFNLKDIPDFEVESLFNQIHQAGLKIQEEGYNYPTAFEIETAMALLYFKKKSCDICIMEVGLGGRLDATNVIPPPLVSIISKISLEHTKYLGNSLEEIAYEKAAIIKPGTHVIVSSQESEAEKKILDSAMKNGAQSIKCIDSDEIILLEESIDYQRLRYKNHEFNFSLIGNFQRINLLAALEALNILNSSGFPINFKKVFKSLEAMHFPGRLEVLHQKPLILIDGAHNLDGIKTLVKNVQTLLPGQKLKVYFGMIEEKDVVNCISEISKIADSIVTLTPDSPDAIDSRDLEVLVKEQTEIPVSSLNSVEEAVENIDFNNLSGLNLFTGSLYLLGSIRSKIQDKIKAIEN